MSTQQKRDRLYDGDTFEHRGATFRVTFPPDEDAGPPWEDGHGIVSQWRPLDSKRPGERVLVSDRGRALLYDVQGSMRKAIAEQWDAEPFGQGTRRQRAARAVERDFQYLEGWCRDRWCYVGVVVERQDAPGHESLWRIESDQDAYLAEVAYELADQILGTEAPDLRRALVQAGAGI